MTGTFNSFTVQSLWNNTPFEFIYNESNGKSGGILAVWDTTLFSLNESLKGDGYLALLGRWRNIDTSCLIVVVYAPQDHRDKKKLWNNLASLIENHNSFSVLLGDFNEVRYEMERLGTIFDKRSASLFNDFIHSTGLCDLPMGGKRFTRMNNIGLKHSKIDRFLVSNHVVHLWPNTNVLALPREFSDHTPILLKTSAPDFGPTPFKLFNTWLEHHEFPALVGLHGTFSTESTCLSSIEVESRNSSIKLLANLEDRKVKDLKQKAKLRWATEDFEASGSIPRGCNSSFITLVPKVEDPLVIGDFRPISLIGSQYKIIAKILANRLSRVLPSVVGEVQMAYIKGRQIIDGPLMVNEIIAWAKNHKKRFMFLKVDFEKAFDSLSWSFLFSILEQMGFSSKWRSWIHACLNSAFASVLVNGSPTKEFKIERGLRQGDPLSPFLFILAVEALNVALLEATSNNIFKGIKVGKDMVHISHLQFADDALIMGEWSRSNAMNLSRILTCFHLASGLKVNFNKSKLYGVGVSNVELNSLASTVGCIAAQFPCTYLGLPIGASMSRCHHWTLLVDRFHKRLSTWKSKSLSIGGRLTLNKSVLGSLGVYYFSTYKAPKKIINKLESIRRNFFWGGSMDDNKIPWIAWEKVLSPRDHGGLDEDALQLKSDEWFRMAMRGKLDSGGDLVHLADHTPLGEKFTKFFDVVSKRQFGPYGDTGTTLFSLPRNLQKILSLTISRCILSIGLLQTHGYATLCIKPRYQATLQGRLVSPYG
ncbi:RNA-directed DNA polymerase, eukaryota [Tanacetum coccineum]